VGKDGFKIGERTDQEERSLLAIPNDLERRLTAVSLSRDDAGTESGASFEL